MSETKNYGLHITDDSSERFSDWQKAMNGPDNSNMIKIDTALGEKANKSIPVNAILLASGWQGTEAPFTQSLFIDGLTADCDGMISLSPKATSAQRKATREAMFSISGQDENQLTIVADGKLPTINIPVVIVLWD